jgi:hypothetical protein
MLAQPFLLPAGLWTEVYDGNATAFQLFRRHYSFSRSKRVPEWETRIAGPGEKMVLLTPDARALFVWRKFISKDQQAGINCAIFRNESAHLSSALIRAAMALAWARWPASRFYTYVNPRKVASPNPGYCFLRAGWRRCGVTKTRRLLVLEVTP